MNILLHHMLFINGLYLQIEDVQLKLRMHLLHFQYAMQIKDFELATDVLIALNELSSLTLNRIGDISIPPPIPKILKPTKNNKETIFEPEIDLNNNIVDEKVIKIANLPQRKANPLKGISNKSRMIQKKKTQLSAQRTQKTQHKCFQA